MRKSFNSLFSFLFVIAMFWSIFSFSSCQTPKQAITNVGVMEYVIDSVVTIDYIDSVCQADTIAKYPDGWQFIPVIDYTSGQNISAEVFYKAWQQSTYRVIPTDDKNRYRFTKRIVK